MEGEAHWPSLPCGTL